jgi:uncharacterized protein YggE
MVGVILSAAFLTGCSDSQTSTVVPSGSESMVTSPNTITVVGDATVSSAPDEAVLTVTVETDGEDPGAAMNQNAEAVTAVIARLQREDVDEADIETTNVSVYPIRTYHPETGQETLVGYRCQNSVKVTLATADEVGRVLSAAVEAGANVVSGPVWKLSDDTAAVTEALRKATEKARAKAEALAEAQGVELGDVVMMTETNVEVPIYPVYESALMKDMASGAVSQTPISPASLDISATVTVTYQLKR